MHLDHGIHKSQFGGVLENLAFFATSNSFDLFTVNSEHNKTLKIIP